MDRLSKYSFTKRLPNVLFAFSIILRISTKLGVAINLYAPSALYKSKDQTRILQSTNTTILHIPRLHQQKPTWIPNRWYLSLQPVLIANKQNLELPTKFLLFVEASLTQTPAVHLGVSRRLCPPHLHSTRPSVQDLAHIHISEERLQYLRTHRPW